MNLVDMSGMYCERTAELGELSVGDTALCAAAA